MTVNDVIGRGITNLNMDCSAIRRHGRRHDPTVAQHLYGRVKSVGSAHRDWCHNGGRFGRRGGTLAQREGLALGDGKGRTVLEGEGAVPGHGGVVPKGQGRADFQGTVFADLDPAVTAVEIEAACAFARAEPRTCVVIDRDRAGIRRVRFQLVAQDAATGIRENNSADIVHDGVA